MSHSSIQLVGGEHGFPMFSPAFTLIYEEHNMEKKKTPWYDKIEKAMLITEMIACLAILFVTVVTRYCFGYTASWSEQAARLLFVWMSFTACSLCGMGNNHLRVTAIDMVNNKKVVDFFYWVGDIIAVLFSFYISYKIGIVLKTVHTTGQVFPAIPWMPATMLYIPGVLGMIGFALRTIQRRIRMIRAAKVVSEEVVNV